MAPRSKIALGAALLAACSILFPACLPPNPRGRPPTNQLYFPTGLAASPGRSLLYVASSDFDLRYSGGTVVGLDLVQLRAQVIPQLQALRRLATHDMAGPTSLAGVCGARGVNTN